MTKVGNAGNVPLMKPMSPLDANFFVRVAGSTAPVEDEAASVLQLADGSYVTAGRTKADAGTTNSILLVRHDALGNVVPGSAKKLSLAGLDIEACAIKQVGDNYVVAGLVKRDGSTTYDVIVLKCDADFNVLPGQSYRYATGLTAGSPRVPKIDLLVTSDGGFLITGRSNGDLMGTKLNADLTAAWCRLFGEASANDTGTSAQEVADGYLLAGTTRSYGHGDSDLMLVKVGLDGTFICAKAIGDANPQYAYAIKVLADGSVLIGGATGFDIGAGTIDNDALLVKTNADGDDPTAVYFGARGTTETGPKEDRINSFTSTTSGDVVAAGYTGSGSGSDDGFVGGVNTAAMAFNWSKTVGSGASDKFSSVAPTSDGGVVLGGSTSGYIDATLNNYLVKLGPAGAITGDCSSVGDFSPTMNSLTWTSLPVTPTVTNVTLTPESINLESAEPTLSEMAICEGPLNVPEPSLPKQNEITVAPNPFNGVVTVKFTSPIDKMQVVDITGKVIDVVSGNGSQSLTWEPSSSVSSGIYFCRIFSGSTVATTKVTYQQ